MESWPLKRNFIYPDIAFGCRDIIVKESVFFDHFTISILIRNSRLILLT